MHTKEDKFQLLKEKLAALRPIGKLNAKIEDISDSDLDLFLAAITFDTPVIEYDKSLSEECHAVTAMAFQEHPEWLICRGLTWTEDLEEWNVHSFLIDDRGYIKEPTTCLNRDLYIGTVLTLSEAKLFVDSQKSRIERLQLTNKIHMHPK